MAEFNDAIKVTLAAPFMQDQGALLVEKMAELGFDLVLTPTGVPVEPTSFWVRFTPEGIPGWFGTQPIEGAEMVDGVTAELLVTHMRNTEGEWIPRPPPAPPTKAELAAYEAELAAQAAAAEQSAVATARQRIEEDIVRLAGPDTLLRAMGKITVAELNARVAAIRATVEAEG